MNAQMDILDANLNSGVCVQKYVPSYGEAPNDLVHVTKCKSDVSTGLYFYTS
jgi:hypothetical protein